MNQLEMIRKIMEAYEMNLESDVGDKHLADPGYTLEAISAVLDDWPDSPVVQEFLKSG